MALNSSRVTVMNPIRSASLSQLVNFMRIEQRSAFGLIPLLLASDAKASLVFLGMRNVFKTVSIRLTGPEET